MPQPFDTGGTTGALQDGHHVRGRAPEGSHGATTRRVALATAAGANAFELSALVQAFVGANDVAGRPLYEIGVAASDPAAPATFGIERPGFSVIPDHPLGWVDGADTVVVPSLGRYLRPPAELVETVARAAANDARVVTVAVGVYVLAATGLLDWRSVTTHWNWADDLADRFPSVRVHGGRLLVQDGRYHSSAGGASTFDLAVHLVEQDHGAELADALARYLVIADRRDVSHDQPRTPHPRTDPFVESLRWTRRHLSEDLAVSDLAERSHMSERTFSRRFHRSIGTSPLDWLLGLRLNRAEEFLVATDWTVARIAEESGFRSESSLRYHFRRRKAASPSEYRRATRVLPTRPPTSPAL